MQVYIVSIKYEDGEYYICGTFNSESAAREELNKSRNYKRYDKKPIEVCITPMVVQ